MAITEENRHGMYGALEELMGHDHATTLMKHLPPVGWADVATKRDLESLEFRIDTRFEAMAHRLDAMEHRLDAILHREISGLKSSFIWMLLASNATFAALVLAAVKLL
ncbi:MAG: hypothetical protein H0W03_08055 [Solirubrobacterales bacterium]|nr:hypothetical protein [Solirubrobacterales bacterium]